MCWSHLFGEMQIKEIVIAIKQYDGNKKLRVSSMDIAYSRSAGNVLVNASRKLKNLKFETFQFEIVFAL